ncbi:hypothetical protein RFI_31186 [Reticulomyxa filosa]|uniref:Pentatricopeptide repeat-containing protein n=1 Tax=Reticulomyxa filosa TaxID=46433 RepID=X6LYG7_RETFI|nr:hypothetical protein RFI_31186 [Reticulomyxa filosa]|eukprot:ETO06212.1 hypothetical protein RFI_31186 [Reticulomyxa filosa]
MIKQKKKGKEEKRVCVWGTKNVFLFVSNKFSEVALGTGKTCQETVRKSMGKQMKYRHSPALPTMVDMHRRRELLGTNKDTNVTNKLPPESLQAIAEIGELWQHPATMYEYLLKWNGTDEQVFGHAIMLCLNTFNFKAAIDIMELALKKRQSQEMSINRALFAKFFQVLCKCDRLEYALPYLDLMTTKYGITPNNIIFSTLISGCKFRGLIDAADHLLNLMTNEFDLEPDFITYGAFLSVCAKSGDLKKAERVNIAILGAMLDVYSSNGHISEMESLFEHACTQTTFAHLEMNEVIYSTIFSGYLKAGNPQKMDGTMERLQTSQISAEEDMKQQFAQVNIHSERFNALAAVACYYLQVQSIKNGEFETETRWHNRVKDLIHEISTHTPELDRNSVGLLVKSHLTHYHKNWLDFVPVFEKEILTKYPQYDVSKDYMTKSHLKCIDLHFCDHIEARFLLRYLLGFNRDQFYTKSNGEILILFGKRKHRRETVNKKDLLHTIENELLSWEQPLRLLPFNDDPSVKKIDPQDLQSFTTRFLPRDTSFCSSEIPLL